MRNACGLDVHKDSVFVCVLNEEGVIFQEKYDVLTTELSTVKAALTGVVTEVDCEVFAQLRKELAMTTTHRAECQSRMAKMCNELFPKQMHDLQTIPGASGQLRPC